jgi:hypothetical protein
MLPEYGIMGKTRDSGYVDLFDWNLSSMQVHFAAVPVRELSRQAASLSLACQWKRNGAIDPSVPHAGARDD